MQREFILNSFLLVVLNLLIKPIYVLGVELRIQNVVGADTWGLYFSLIGFVYFFQFINDFGFSHYVRKYLSGHREEIGRVFPGLLATKTLFSAAFVCMVYVSNLIFRFERVHVGLLLLIAINFLLTTYIQLYRAGLAGMGHYKADSLLSSLDKLLLIVLMLLVFYQFDGRFGLWHFVWAQTISLSLTIFIAAATFYRRHGMPLFRWKVGVFLRYLKQSFPFALIIMLMSVYSRLDSVMLRSLLPDGMYQAGSYGAAFRLYDAAAMFVVIIGSLLLPMSAHLIGDRKKMEQIINQAIRVVLIMTTIGFLLSSLYASQIMEYLYIEYEENWGRVFLWLMFGFIPLAFGNIFGVLMMANNQIRTLNQIFLSALVLNVLLNLWLIPMHKAVGASIATAITQFVVIAAEIILFSRQYKWRLKAPSRLALYVFGSMIMAYALSLLDYFWPINMILIAFALCMWVFLSKMLSIRSLVGNFGPKL